MWTGRGTPYTKNMSQVEFPFPAVRRCSKCAVDKPIGDFYTNGTTQSRVLTYSTCKKCHNAKTAEYRKKIGPAKFREWQVLRAYGLTTEQLFERRSKQKGLCAICEMPPRREVIDHHHASGKARGLLCDGCNMKLAALEHPDFFAKAMVYLAAWGTPPPWAATVDKEKLA